MTTKETVCIIGACLFVLYIVTGPIICLVQLLRDKLAARAEHRRWQESSTPAPAPRQTAAPIRPSSGREIGFTYVYKEDVENRANILRYAEKMNATPRGGHGVQEPPGGGAECEEYHQGQ